MTDTFAQSNEIIGRILTELVKTGLRKHNFDANEFWDMVDQENWDYVEFATLFEHVLDWMAHEYLVSVDDRQAYLDRTPTEFRGVQLTSRGIAVATQRANSFLGGESISDKVAENGQSHDSASWYADIGAFVGGLLGGVIKSAQ
jgi:hypothetical protein